MSDQSEFFSDFLIFFNLTRPLSLDFVLNKMAAYVLKIGYYHDMLW